MNARGFFAELKRRNVYKIAVAYGVVGWLVMQVAATIVPALHLSEAITSAVVVLVLLGFPIALVLAWAFEVTPEGIKRTEEVGPNESITRRTGRKLVGLTIVLALLAAGLFAFRLLRPNETKSAMPSAGALPPPAAIPEKSIAVLPFENLSSDKENVFFTDGVQDEILTDLAKVADLKVISRTSVMQYRDASSRNSRKIGQELGVAHLLEGSVQRAEGKVRVNAQLIDARTDAHLWAQTYDRDLKGVFAIQSEIAETIADQLQARLSPRERKAIQQPATTDVTAHDLFLRARELDDLVNISNSKESLLQAIQLLDQAVQRDPQYYRAYCLMVEVHTDLYWGGFDPTPERLKLAKVALEKAESIDPKAGEVHFAKATYLYHGFRDYAGARAEFEIAGTLLPNSARVPMLIGAIDRRQGRWDDAVLSFQRAVQTDPRDAFVYEEAGFTFSGLGRYAEAKSYLERAYALNPKDHFAGAVLSQLPYFERGETAGWRAHLDEVERAGHAATLPISFIECALAERNRAAAEKALALVPPEGTTDSTTDFNWPRDWFVGLVARSFGDEEKARTAFTAARAVVLPTTQKMPDYPGGWIMLGLIDAGLGNKSEAIAEGKRACELLPLSKDAWDGPSYLTNLALIYTWLGEKDLALEQLALPAKIPAGVTYGELKMSPRWDPLRSDPRFEEIVRAVAPGARESQAQK